MNRKVDPDAILRVLFDILKDENTGILAATSPFGQPGLMTLQVEAFTFPYSDAILEALGLTVADDVAALDINAERVVITHARHDGSIETSQLDYERTPSAKAQSTHLSASPPVQ